jgi:SMC interacting uncharacterized protein involved in chromosome segregation
MLQLTKWEMHRGCEELIKNDVKNDLSENRFRRKAYKALVMKDIVNYIVKHGNMDLDVVVSKIGGIMTEEELKRTNVFVYHPSTLSYTFATRALKTVYQVSKNLLISTVSCLFSLCV